MTKQKIIKYYFYKHYFIWFLLIYLIFYLNVWFVFLNEIKDVNNKINHFIAFLAFGSLIFYFLKEIALVLLLKNKKYIQFLTKTIKENYNFDLKNMFINVFNHNHSIDCYFNEIAFFANENYSEQRKLFFRDEKFFLPKYKNIINNKIVKNISLNVKEEICFKDREFILKNKNVIIDFLSNLEVDFDKIKKKKSQRQKDEKNNFNEVNLIKSLKKLKENEKEINHFLKKF